MGIKDKIVNALVRELQAEYVRLRDEDGISGFAVSRQFEGVSSLDRQDQIEEALKKARLSKDEQRRILMIAAVTPTEYNSVGAHIRIQQIKRSPGQALEVILHGTPGDAEYVRKALQIQNGVETTEPKPVSGAVGDLMAFRAKGTDAPLTKEKAIRVLKSDPYIEVMAKA